MIIDCYSLANKVAKGYSNATVLSSVRLSFRNILVNTLESTSACKVKSLSVKTVTKWGFCAHKTGLILPPFIEVPAPDQESEKNSKHDDVQGFQSFL
jgi:hypothetical protein